MLVGYNSNFHLLLFNIVINLSAAHVPAIQTSISSPSSQIGVPSYLLLSNAITRSSIISIVIYIITPKSNLANKQEENVAGGYIQNVKEDNESSITIELPEELRSEIHSSIQDLIEEKLEISGDDYLSIQSNSTKAFLNLCVSLSLE